MANPVRVMRIIARMNVGGPAWQTSTLSTRMDPDRFTTLMVAGTVEPHETDYLQLRPVEDLPITFVPEMGREIRPRQDAVALRRLVRLMREFRPHLVHTHTAKAGTLGRIAAQLAGVPAVVHTFHGHLLYGNFSRLGTTGVVGVERTLARTTDVICSVGGRVRDELLDAGIGRPDQYEVVPPGVDLPPLPSQEEARADLDIPQGVPVVLMPARITEVKRPDRFVQMAMTVAGKVPDVHFVVAGDGPLRAHMEDLAAPLGERFRVLGWRGDIHRIYAACDVACLSSDNEGMPVALLEAGMAGRPAVVPLVGATDEVVDDGVTGFVVDPEAQALADALITVLTDDALAARMGEAAKARVESTFSADRLVEQTAQIYERVLRSKGLLRDA